MEMSETEPAETKRQVRNAGRTVGAKRALKPKQIWEIRFYLNQHRPLRDRALFDLAIDSKLRGCDLVRMKIGDIVSGGHVRSRAIVMQQKTGRPVQFELLPAAGESLSPTTGSLRDDVIAMDLCLSGPVGELVGHPTQGSSACAFVVSNPGDLNFIVGHMTLHFARDIAASD